jgi:hypothetical protein
MARVVCWWSQGRARGSVLEQSPGADLLMVLNAAVQAAAAIGCMLENVSPAARLLTVAAVLPVLLLARSLAACGPTG